MKVVVLSHVSDYTGGAERSILNVLDIWSKKYGIEPVFILRKPLGSYVAQLEKRGWEYHAIDFTYWSDSNLPKDRERRFTHTLRNSRAVLAIQDILKRVQPDFVITNSIIAPWAAIAAYYSRIPHVWFAREFGGADQGREFEISQADTFNDIINLSCLVIANSETLAKHIRTFQPQAKNVTHLYNPFSIKDIVKSSKESAQNPFKHEDSLKLMLVSGGINRHKGQLEAVEAIALLNHQDISVELCLVGRNVDPDFSAQLHEIIDQNSMADRVHFVGYKSNPMSLVKYTDIGITASTEAFGRVTFEFLALKKPVVGADTGATSEMVIDDITGKLFKKGDAKSLAKAINYYVENRALVSKHGKKGLEFVTSMMEGPHNAEELYHKALKHVEANRDSMKDRVIINYTHEWLHYPEIAKNYYEQRHEESLLKILKSKAKQRLRKPYHYIKAQTARWSKK